MNTIYILPLSKQIPSKKKFVKFLSKKIWRDFPLKSAAFYSSLKIIIGQLGRNIQATYTHTEMKRYKSEVQMFLGDYM